MSLGKHRLDGVKGQSLAHGGAQGSAPQQVQPVPGGHADPGESEGEGGCDSGSGGEQERGNADGVLYLHAALVERRQDAALVQSGVSKAFVEKRRQVGEELHVRSGGGERRSGFAGGHKGLTF